MLTWTIRLRTTTIHFFITVNDSLRQHESGHVVTIYGIDAVANEIDVVLKFFDSGMKIQDFN
jgi:hypothetical protein